MANEVGSLNVRVGLDGTNFKEGIKQINRELKIAQTELKANATAIGGFGNSLEQLKLKSNSLQKQLSLHREKVQALEKEYRRSVQVTGENSRESQNLAIQLNNAKTAMNRVQNTLNSTNKKIEEQNKKVEEQTNKWNKLSKQLKTTGEKLNNIGTKITDVGKSLSLKLTAPLAGVGFASVKTAIDFESSMSEVQAISGATGEQLKTMEEKAKEMGEKTSKSASESAQALKYMSLAGWDVETSIKALEPVLRLSEAGNLDLARASDLVTDSMSALGLTSEQLQGYLDRVAKTQASANTSADGMLEAYITAGGMFRQLNTDLDTSSAMIGILANRGIKASEAGTSLNSILVNLTGSTEKSSKVFNELGISLYDQQGNYKGVEQVLLDLKSRFSELDQEQQNFYMAQIAGKTQIDTFSALLDGLGKEYFDLKEDIKKSDGALLESARIMKDNFKGELEATRSKLESVGLIIANYLTPTLREFNKGFQKVLDSFEKLSPQTQENIVKFGLLAGAIPPILLAGGMLVSSISTITTGLSSLTGALAGAELASVGVGTTITGLATTIGTATLTIAPYALALGGIALIGKEIYNSLHEKATPAVESLSDVVKRDKQVQEDYYNSMQNKVTASALTVNENFGKISEATAKAVDGYLTLDRETSKSLMNLQLNNSEITEQIVTDLTSKFSKMGEQIKTSLDSSYKKNENSLKQLFENSKAITQEEQNAILQSLKVKNEEKKKIYDNYNKQITDILAKASEEHRQLTEKEQKEINAIQELMREGAVKTFSASEEEQRVILEKIKNDSVSITTEQASEIIKRSIETKDKVIQEANEQYDKTLATIIKQRDELGTISAEQADKLIKEAQRQKDDTIFNATQMHEQTINLAKENYGNTVNLIDITTGEIKTKWEQMKDNSVSTFNNLRTDSIRIWNTSKTDTSNIITNIKTDISNKWNEILGDVKSIGTKIKQSLSDMWKFEIPKIKLPHFEIKGKFSIDPPSVPSFGVNWHADGGIFTRATLLPSLAGNIHGVGEAGAEAILPIEKLKGMIRGEMQNVINNQAAEININITGDWIVDNDSRKVEVVQELSSELKTFFRARGVTGGVY